MQWCSGAFVGRFDLVDARTKLFLLLFVKFRHTLMYQWFKVCYLWELGQTFLKRGGGLIIYLFWRVLCSSDWAETHCVPGCPWACSPSTATSQMLGTETGTSKLNLPNISECYYMCLLSWKWAGIRKNSVRRIKKSSWAWCGDSVPPIPVFER